MKRIIIIAAIATFMLFVGVGIGSKSDPKPSAPPSRAQAASVADPAPQADPAPSPAAEPVKRSPEGRQPWEFKMAAEMTIEAEPSTCDTMAEGIAIFGRDWSLRQFAAGYQPRADAAEAFAAIEAECGL